MDDFFSIRPLLVELPRNPQAYGRKSTKDKLEALVSLRKNLQILPANADHVSFARSCKLLALPGDYHIAVVAEHGVGQTIYYVTVFLAHTSMTASIREEIQKDFKALLWLMGFSFQHVTEIRTATPKIFEHYADKEFLERLGCVTARIAEPAGHQPVDLEFSSEEKFHFRNLSKYAAANVAPKAVLEGSVNTVADWRSLTGGNWMEHEFYLPQGVVIGYVLVNYPVDGKDRKLHVVVFRQRNHGSVILPSPCLLPKVFHQLGLSVRHIRLITILPVSISPGVRVYVDPVAYGMPGQNFYLHPFWFENVIFGFGPEPPSNGPQMLEASNRSDKAIGKSNMKKLIRSIKAMEKGQDTYHDEFWTPYSY